MQLREMHVCDIVSSVMDKIGGSMRAVRLFCSVLY
jgi:hypothetical protein